MLGGRGVVTAAFLAVFIAMAAPTAPAEEAQRTLYIYTWKDYFRPDIIEDFAEKYNCRVEMDYYDSNETILAMFGDTGSGYDIITPVATFTSTLRKNDKLLPLNHALLPNLRHIDADTPAIYDDREMRYSIPYTLTITGIGYNKTQISPEDLAEGWALFGNARLAGRMAMLNDIREVLGVGLKALGFSANSVNPEELRAAAKLVQGWKKKQALFDVDAARSGLNTGRFAIIQTYSGELAALMRDNPDVGFHVPKEGTTLNSDHFVIDAKSASPDLAHAFINYLMEPDVAARNMDYTRYYMPNPEALRHYGPDARKALALDVPDAILDKSEALHTVGAGREAYEAAWSEVLFGGQ